MSNVIGSLCHALATSLAAPEAAGRFTEGSPVCIYGTGQAAREVFRALTERGISVIAYLDRRAESGQTIQGVPVYQPDTSVFNPAERQRLHVVIGIFNGYVDVLPIRQRLTELGFGKLTSFVELYEQFAGALGDRFWLTPRSFYRSAEASLQQAFAILSDEPSRQLFLSTLEFRFTHNVAVLPKPDTAHQYFDPTVPALPQPFRFVDCGAYDGDTFASFQRAGLLMSGAVAFEPDLANFNKLCLFFAKERDTLPSESYLFPCGVDATSRQLRFSSAQGTGSRLDAGGDTVIQCVAIDDVIPGFAPNFIKMDIEGAELSALWGAERTILKYRPRLAICLYHRPEHLWQIPQHLHRWYGDKAKYFIRSHGYNGFETVLYVVPE